MKKKAGIALFVAASALVAFSVYIAKYPKSVSWEVVTEENRAKYIEVLKKQNIPFSEETNHLGRRWITVKGYQLEELDELTKEYDEWANGRYKNQGTIVNGK